jgi:enoyl-CoA hydratase/carnithine racemase
VTGDVCGVEADVVLVSPGPLRVQGGEAPSFFRLHGRAHRVNVRAVMFTLTLDPPEVSPRLAVITIDRPGEKVNTIAPEALEEVEQQFAAIEATPGLAGIVLISGKPDTFIAGADVEVFAQREGAPRHRGLRAPRPRDPRGSPAPSVPIVAAIHGACLGAGLELALACTYRVCSDSPKTVLALPEVMLGLFPGGGGVSRLPRLVGLREALDMILTGRNIRPRAAKRMGLVDQVVAEEALLPAARARRASSRRASCSRGCPGAMWCARCWRRTRSGARWCSVRPARRSRRRPSGCIRRRWWRST